jgi:hypothetical protein
MEIISTADTLIKPLAMMIKAFNAFIAKTAMFSLRTR